MNIKPDYTKEFLSDNVYIDEWGSKRQITDEYINPIIENPLKDLKDYKSFKFPDPYAKHRFENLEKATKKIGKDKAIILNLRDIWSDIREILGYENALISLVTDLDNFNKLLDKCIDYNHALAEVAHKRCGTDILVTTDDICDNNNVIFGPQLYYSNFASKFKRVINGYKKIGYYCIKHCDGNIMDIIDSFIDSGVDCIDPIDPNGEMNIRFIKEKYGNRVCLKGNINCTKTLVDGSFKDIENEVKNCIKRAALGGGYIISSSNTIHSRVKPENYLRMLEVLKKYGNYPINYKEL